MGKFLKWFFGIICFVVFAGIITLVIFIANFDLNQYKEKIEKIVLEQTGRQLSLNGDIGLKISLIPTVRANDVTLSNALWASQSEMIKVKEADVSLAVLPLLDKKIEIKNISLIEPVVNLSMNNDGVGNWVFEKPIDMSENQEPSQKAEEKADDLESNPAAPLLAGFFAQKIEIQNGLVRYEDLKSKSLMNAEIKSILFSSDGPDEEIYLSFDVVYNQEAFEGKLTGDALDVLWAQKPYHVYLEANAYQANIKADAVLKDIMTDVNFNGNVSVISPDGNFDLPKTELVADVEGTVQNIQTVIQKLDMGGNVLSGKINLNLSGSKPVIKGNLRSKNFDLGRLTPQKKTAFMNFIGEAHAASFVPKGNLDLSVLKTFDATVDAEIAQLILNPDMSLQNLKGNIQIQNGILTLNPFSVVVGGGNVTGQASLNSSGNNLKLHMEGKNVVLQEFLKNLAARGDNFGFQNGGVTNVYIDLTSQGTSYQKLFENLNGQVLINVGESRLYSGSLKYLKGNFIGDLLSTLQIKAKDPNMKMKCFVLRADFKDGKVSLPRGIAFDSKQMTIVGDGYVNLKNDGLDIVIKPFNGNLTETNIAQAVSSLVKVSGTIDNPSIAIDTASVVKNAIGFALTGPAFIGSQLLLDSDSAPCYTALKDTVYKNAYEAPTGVKAGAQGVYKGTSDVVSGGVNAVTGAAGSVVGTGVDVLNGAAKGIFNMFGGNSKKK